MLMKKILFVISLIISQHSLSEGLVFECDETKIKTIDTKLHQYFNQLNIQENFFEKIVQKNTIRFSLKNNHPDTSTLYIRWNPKYNIQDEIVYLPSEKGLKEVSTVSKKEILLALMQSGRRTVFSGKSCELEALEDHLHVRQMIVAWAENLQWKFPDGGSAQWNESYWKDGTLKPGKPLLEAMTDFFINPNQCSVGCYTATKIVIIQGVLDYYQRIKKDSEKASQVKKILRSDGEVLVNIEPDAMWQLIKKEAPETKSNSGKLLSVKNNIAPLNFIPGDWVYFINTDPKSSDRPGYEGSNSIYMGRAKFDDFYNDNGHYYFYHEKLLEVYNWRHGVFSRSNDYDKLQPLSSELLHSLGLSPQKGGLVLDSRSVPKYFGFE